MAAANSAVEMLPMGVDAWVAGDMIENRAWTSALLGEVDPVLDDIEFLLAKPTRSWISTSLLKMDPRWDRVRHHPRFQALLAEYSEEGQW